MGGPGLQRPAQERRHRRLGGLIHHRLQHIAFRSGVHLPSVSSRCPVSRRVLLDLLWPSLPHPGQAEGAKMELGCLEQTVSNYRHGVESVAGGSLVLTMGIPSERRDLEL